MTAKAPTASLLGRLGRTIARAPKRTLLLLVALIALVAVASATLGDEYDDSVATPDSDSERATELLQAAFPQAAGDSSTVVVQVKAGTLEDRQDAITGLVRDLSEVPSVVAVQPPVREQGSVSEDGTVGLITVQHDAVAADLGPAPGTEIKSVAEGATDRSDGALTAEVSGPVIDTSDEGVPPTSELLGLLVALITLMLLFRSLWATGIVLAVALASVAVGIVALPILAGIINVPEVAFNVGLLLGLGVGIDYALLMVHRHRSELRRPIRAGEDDPGSDNASNETALTRAVSVTVATAGRAVVEAGSIVIVAISTMLLIGIPFVATLGIAAGMVVLITVLGSLTAIPSILSLAGRRLLPKAERQEPVAAAPDSAAAATTRPHSSSVNDETADASASTRAKRVEAWFAGLRRRPGAAAAAAVVVLVALAAPILGLRLALPDDGTDPGDNTQRRAYDIVEKAFGPGANGPLIIVSTFDRADNQALEELTARIQDLEGVARTSPPMVNEAGNAALWQVTPTTAPESAETQDLVRTLRDDVLPAYPAAGEPSIGGATAAAVDLSSQIGERLPLFLGTVVALAMVLLGVTFRSLWIPVVSALLNLASIGAAYGVLVAAFQTDTGAGLMGLDDSMAVVSFVPVVMFAILFGLSMDYNIFQLSRIRELVAAGRPARDAVSEGVNSTVGVITAAAVIMIAVFGAFVLNPDPVLKQLGFGMAIAVLIDVTLIRMVLSPAALFLLGERAWRRNRPNTEAADGESADTRPETGHLVPGVGQ